MTIWITGRSGSGKTTIAKELTKHIPNSFILDGDEVRKIFRNTRFDRDARILNGQQVVELAALIQSQGFVPIVSLISPYIETRQLARSRLPSFFEVYLSTSLAVCIKRDVKGLYAKGVISHEDSYEEYDEAEMVLDTEAKTVTECVNQIKYKHLFKGFYG